MSSALRAFEEGLNAARHKLSLTSASGLGLGARGVGFGLLRHREGIHD
jgi:hypothetical protein